MAAPSRHLRLRAGLAASALAAAALGLAGCGDSGITGGGRVIGSTVTVYSMTADPGGATSDLVDGEKLALEDAHGRAGALAVNFSALDLGSDKGTAAAAVRQAISDPQIIATVSAATPVTVPLFNEAGLLHVAPSGNMALATEPNELPTGKRTVAPLDSTAAGRQPLPAGFAARYRAAFDRAPDPAAGAGYRAMRSVLEAIGRAGGRGNDRQTVIDKYFRGS